MTSVPYDVFGPGGKKGLTQEQELDIVPLGYFVSHPLARKWWAKAMRSGLGAAVATDTAIQLQNGFEGIIQFMALLGHANVQGSNQGIGWRILLDGSTPLNGFWGVAAGLAPPTLDQSGRFDYLQAGDGAGSSWGEINLWLPENTLVEVQMNNNGGAADSMGWTMWGMYWPITVRDFYYQQKKKGRVG